MGFYQELLRITHNGLRNRRGNKKVTWSQGGSSYHGRLDTAPRCGLYLGFWGSDHRTWGGMKGMWLGLHSSSTEMFVCLLNWLDWLLSLTSFERFKLWLSGRVQIHSRRKKRKVGGREGGNNRDCWKNLARSAAPKSCISLHSPGVLRNSTQRRSIWTRSQCQDTGM